MPGLRHSLPEPRLVGEPVAVDHRDLLKVVGEGPGGQQACHPGTNHDGVGALPTRGLATDMIQSEQLTHPLLSHKKTE